MRSYRKELFIAVILSAVFLRFVNIGMPLLEATMQRQIQTAGITRFFYLNGFDIMRSRLDYLAGNSAYLVLEFPLYNVMCTLLYGLLGGVREWAARAMSICFFLGSGGFVYGICRRIYNPWVGLIAAAIYLFSPLGIMFSRTVMPDSTMMFFYSGSLFFMFRYYRDDRKLFFWVSALFCMLSILVKPQSSFVFIPLTAVIYLKEGRKLLASPKNYFFYAVILIPAALWFMSASNANMVLSPHRVANFRLSNWFDPSQFLSFGYYRNVLDIVSGVLLTPIGFFLLLCGIAVKITRREERILYAWLLGAVLYIIVFNALMWEPYYYLPVLPVFSVFAARFFLLDLDAISKRLYSGARVLVLMAVFAFLIRYASASFLVPSGYRYIPGMAETIERLTGPSDIIAINKTAGSEAVLYYSNRKGLTMAGFKGEGESLDVIGAYRGEGAGYAAIIFDGSFNSDLTDEMISSKYTLLFKKEGEYSVFKLDGHI